MNRFLIICAAAAAFMLSAVPASAAEPLQTQMGQNGEMEADVLKAKVDGQVLTVAIAFRNTGDAKTIVEFKWHDVYFIDKSQTKKYHVLKDNKGVWVASQVYYGGVRQTIDAGKKKLIWFKFPAPPEGDDSINLTIPAALPFDGLRITR